jgi:hypothetical protein
MPRAGLAEATWDLLRGAVADEQTTARFHAKLRRVPGSSCCLFTGAVSGRGHGRFWVGTVLGRDVVVIAHRFAWALEHGVDALATVPVLGHRCDNPLCQRIGPGHVEASSAWRNRQEWLMRRHTIGTPLRDQRGARGRARAVRDALRVDPTGVRAVEVMRSGLAGDLEQLPLWADAGSTVPIGLPSIELDHVVEQCGLGDRLVGPQHLDAVLPATALPGSGRDLDAVPPVVEPVVEQRGVAGDDDGGPRGA